MSAKQQDAMNSRELYLRLLSYVRPYWVGCCVTVACMGLAALVEPLFPALMKHLLDDGFSGGRGQWDWLFYPAAIFGIFLVRAALGFVSDYTMMWIANNVIAEMRNVMFAKVLRLPAQYFSDHASGRLMSRVAYDAMGVATASIGVLTTLIKDSLTVIGLLAWLMYLNWQLTMVTVMVIPFIAVAVRSFSSRFRQVARAGQDAQGNITQILQEAIEGQKVVKIFGGHAYEETRFAKAVGDHRRSNMRATVASAIQGPIVQFFVTLALAVIIGVALYQSASGQASVGSFVSFITAMLMVLAPLKRVTDVNAPLQRGLAAAESVFSVIDERAEADAGTENLGRAVGLVQFENVTFAYPGAERAALVDLSFTIRPGESVALVGPSGSGKTTSANLLPRFYHAQEGVIRVDGHSLENIALNSLRENIALVSQEVVLFNDTVAANIAYGCKRAVSRESILAAAKDAHAMEFIEKLPDGLETLVGEKGVKLSGGQRQRLAIARALLKDAPILILDEATSALDTESERQVQAALDRLMAGRSTLIIAHRLSTIEGVDRIITLADGRKMEEGGHAELLAQDGLYARLHRMQKLTEAA